MPCSARRRQQPALDLEPRRGGLGLRQQAARHLALELGQLVAIDGEIGMIHSHRRAAAEQGQGQERDHAQAEQPRQNPEKHHPWPGSRPPAGASAFSAISSARRLRSASLRGSGAPVRPAPQQGVDAAGTEQQQQRGPAPEQQGLRLEGRIEENEIAVAGNQIGLHLIVAVAGREPLAHDHAQIMGEIGVGFVDRLVLADEAAQLPADGPRAGLQRRILQHLRRLDGEGGGRQNERQQQRQQDEGGKSPSHRPDLRSFSPSWSGEGPAIHEFAAREPSIGRPREASRLRGHRA